MSEPKIVAAEIGPYARDVIESLSIGLPKVKATFDDGSTKVLFDFYPDEISFSESEFIGLTVREALILKGKKDLSYLQS